MGSGENFYDILARHIAQSLSRADQVRAVAMLFDAVDVGNDEVCFSAIEQLLQRTGASERTEARLRLLPGLTLHSFDTIESESGRGEALKIALAVLERISETIRAQLTGKVVLLPVRSAGED